MNRRHLLISAAALLASACVPMATSPAAAPAQAKTFRFMAGFKPQANLPFVGAYVAQTNGYFAEQNLNVEILHSAGNGEHLKLLLQGTVDATTAAGDAVLLRRAEDLPVVAFALFGQRSDRAYAALASSEIRSPKDWEGKIVGYKSYPTPDYLAMLSASGVDRSKIQEVPVGFDPRLLAAGKVDVYPVFESNEPDTLARLGVPTRLFRPNDYGQPGLGLTYITRQELATQDPDVLARFLKASLKGIEFAKANPEKATDIIMQFAPQEDRDHQLQMLKVELDMAESALTKTNGLGWTTKEQWQSLKDSLIANDGLKGNPDVTTAYTDKILNLAYRKGQLVWP